MPAQAEVRDRLGTDDRRLQQGIGKQLAAPPLGRVQLVGAFAPVGNVVGAEVKPGCHVTLRPEELAAAKTL